MENELEEYRKKVIGKIEEIQDVDVLRYIQIFLEEKLKAGK